MEKRTLYAILLTVLVWVGWFWIFPPPSPVEVNKATQSVSQENVSGTKSKKETKKISKTKTNAKYSKISHNIKEKEISINTDKFHFKLSNKGAVIKATNYIERNTDLNFESEKFKSAGSFDFAVHFTEDEFFAGNDLQRVNWAVQKQNDNTVKFYTDITVQGSKLRIEKIFTFIDNAYDFIVEYKFINQSRKDIKLANGEVIISAGTTVGPKLDYKNTYNVMKGIYSMDGDFQQSKKGGFFGGKEALFNEAGSIDYAGIMGRYFLLIMRPENFTGSKVYSDTRKNTGFRTGMAVDIGTIEKKSLKSKSFKVYLGEKNKDYLKSVDPLLVDASDVNTLIEPIRYFVMWVLLGLNGFLGNIGWSLVIFSILTKIVFMPLTKKSTESMKKLQEIGPELKKIKEKYKDKPDVVQRETMRMYKENKVNPLGGCLPMVLQMPFFFGLYSALINSIDLWNAPFILWMKDLSMPDSIGSLAGHNIHILPLLMAVSMFVQQKQTMSESGSQQQKMMMYMMPFLMLAIFWTMPSGLVLYWFLQNLYQILHQYVVNHMDNRKKRAAA